MAPRKETEQARTARVAVLLADTFHQGFEPISHECAPVLLPLLNVPLIEYGLEWLAANEVNEVLVFCCGHADQIVTYLEGSKWSAESEFMKVQAVVGKTCSSVGDAMRFVDQMHVVKNDFLILNADHVVNLVLKNAMEEHLARRQEDSSAIMTVIMTSGHDAEHRLRLGETSSHAVVDPVCKRLLSCKESKPHRKARSLECETAFFSERDTIEVRSDLMNSHIYICAPEVLMLFTENFDYQNLSVDFIGGVLSEEELGNKIFFYESSKAYVQRVQNLRRYDAVSRDVLGRWTYPFLPDTRIFSGALNGATYRFQPGNQYLASELRLPLTVQIQGNVCIGPSTTIGDECIIKHSVIGKDCIVGKNSVIEGSYIQGGVKIGKNVKIISSFLCSGSVVLDNAVVQEGSLLSFGVVISRQHTVPPLSRISLCRPTLDKSSGEDEGTDTPQSAEAILERSPERSAREAAMALAAGSASQVARPSYFSDDIVGKNGAGAEWPVSNGHAKLLSVSQPSLEYLEEFEQEKDEVSSDEESGASVGALDPDQAFAREVEETFLRCVYQKFNEENVVLELNGLKLAEVRTFVECASYIFTTLLQMCMPPPPHIRPDYHSLFSKEHHDLNKVTDQKKFLAILKKVLTEWSTILQRFLKDEDDQVELMFAFEEFFKGEGVFNLDQHWGKSLGPLIPNICQLLYNDDIVAEDAFLSWATEKESATDAEDLVFYNKAKVFIDWLREAEESESDD